MEGEKLQGKLESIILDLEAVRDIETKYQIHDVMSKRVRLSSPDLKRTSNRNLRLSNVPIKNHWTYFLAISKLAGQLQKIYKFDFI